MPEDSEIKERQRAMWSAGDYAEVAPTIEVAATGLIEGLGIEAGQDVLDVACGTGNATIPAAQLGATVTGIDLTPKLLEGARERATALGVEATFVEGDAELLPFEDATFDRVTSVFGAMFAPDQQRTAGELVRVCRPGGVIGLCAWTPEGVNGRLFGVLGSRLPPPPPGFTPPMLWGSEDHVRELFARHGVSIQAERRSVTFEHESVEGWVAFHERTLGPVIMAKAALEPAGEWEAVRRELEDFYAVENEATDGTMRLRAEYLVTTIGVPS